MQLHSPLTKPPRIDKMELVTQQMPQPVLLCTHFLFRNSCTQSEGTFKAARWKHGMEQTIYSSTYTIERSTNARNAPSLLMGDYAHRGLPTSRDSLHTWIIPSVSLFPVPPNYWAQVEVHSQLSFLNKRSSTRRALEWPRLHVQCFLVIRQARLPAERLHAARIATHIRLLARVHPHVRFHVTLLR